MGHWSPDDIPWQDFDAGKVDADILKVVKAAAMVEKNAADYASYLRNVFPDDPAFQKAAGRWAEEEVQHGDVLGRWAELADPEFDFAKRFAVFQEGYKIPVESTQSIRGSRACELVARCVVEVGTSSYYSALRDAADEPVLKAICGHIAADEFRHYKLFFSYLSRYQEAERTSRWAKIKVVLSRIAESDDDELSYAYFAANGRGEAYDHRTNADAYAARAYRFYNPAVVQRGIAMSLDAAGLPSDGVSARMLSRLAWNVMDWRRKRLAHAVAA
jgi:rubrerythrin